MQFELPDGGFELSGFRGRQVENSRSSKGTQRFIDLAGELFRAAVPQQLGAPEDEQACEVGGEGVDWPGVFDN